MSEIKEVFQPNEKAKELIANASADFLRSRMKITQKILSNNPETITLDEYINGLTKVKDNRQESREYINENSKKILISDEEIEELVCLVKESLTKYSLADFAFSGVFSNLVKYALVNLEKNIEKDKTLSLEEKELKLKIIKKWKEISNGKHAFGIDPRIDGRISWRYLDEFYITDSKNHMVCKIGLDGTDKMISEYREKQEEEILFANNLFVGRICISGRESFDIFLYNENNNKAKTIGRSKMYPLVKENDYEPYVEFDLNLNAFLDSNGLSYLSEDLYDEFMIERIRQVYNGSLFLSEKEKENIEIVINYAVEWWANAILNPTFDNGDLNTSLMANDLSARMPKPPYEKIEKFKQYLGNEIRAGILSEPYGFTLGVDYDPDIYLQRAAAKAKLDTGICSFPWKTTMTITIDKVSVRSGYNADAKIIYDANQYSLGSSNNK